MALHWRLCARWSVSLALVVLAIGRLVWAKDDEVEPRESRDVEQFSLAWLQPILVNMGMSGAAGLAVGAALKRVSRTIAAAAGVVIIAVQVLVWQDFIVVKWDNVESKLKPYLDVDGDGIITEKDAQHVLEGGMGVLSQGLPNVGGFASGVLLGMKLF